MLRRFLGLVTNPALTGGALEMVVTSFTPLILDNWNIRVNLDVTIYNSDVKKARQLYTLVWL